MFVYVLFFATGMAYALIARKMGAWSYKAGVGVALVAGFVLGWSNMVHVADSENPANLVYFSVLAVGAVGAWLARLEARGMARTLFAMAATLALAVITLLSSGAPPDLCAENGHRAWCLRGVVHRVRSAVPAREFGGIEVRPRPITKSASLGRVPD